MQGIKCQIRLVDPWLPALRRDHNQFIMDVALNSPLINNSLLDPINWCRLYMQHLTITDITTSDRKYLAHYFDLPEPPLALPHNPEYEWPQQGRPNSIS
eukprot:1564361-Ditylum_brightwellii.AAC.1